MKIKKKFCEIEEGDLVIKNPDYYWIDFNIFPKYNDEKNIRDIFAKGGRMFPTGSHLTGTCYSFWDSDSIIEVITCDETKHIIEAYNELTRKNKELKELIFKQDAIPILYTSDTTLNYPLEIGDVLLKRSFEYNDEVELLVIQDTKYRNAFEDIPQKEQFYEWATESYHDYRITIPGKTIKVTNLWSQYHDYDTFTSFNIGAYKTDCFLLEEVKNPKRTADKIRDMHNPFYNILKELYNKYYGELKEEPKIISWNYDPDIRK